MRISQIILSFLAIFAIYVVSINAYVGNRMTRWRPKVNKYGEPTKAFVWDEDEILNLHNDQLDSLSKKRSIGGIFDMFIFLGRYPVDEILDSTVGRK